MSSPVGTRVPGMFVVTVGYVIKLFPSLGTPDQILLETLARSSLHQVARLCGQGTPPSCPGCCGSMPPVSHQSVFRLCSTKGAGRTTGASVGQCPETFKAPLPVLKGLE